MSTNQNGQNSGLVNGNSEEQPGVLDNMPDNQGKSVLGCILDRLRELSLDQLTTGTSLSDYIGYPLYSICTSHFSGTQVNFKTLLQ